MKLTWALANGAVTLLGNWVVFISDHQPNLSQLELWTQVLTLFLGLLYSWKHPMERDRSLVGLNINWSLSCTHIKSQMLGYSTIFGDWTNQGFLRVPDRSTTAIHPTYFFPPSPVAARRGIGVWWPHVCMEKLLQFPHVSP